MAIMIVHPSELSWQWRRIYERSLAQSITTRKDNSTRMKVLRNDMRSGVVSKSKLKAKHRLGESIAASENVTSTFRNASVADLLEDESCKHGAI